MGCSVSRAHKTSWLRSLLFKPFLKGDYEQETNSHNMLACSRRSDRGDGAEHKKAKQNNEGVG